MKRNTFKKGFKPHYERILNTWNYPKSKYEYTLVIRNKFDKKVPFGLSITQSMQLGLHYDIWIY